tara:strand:- start:212 stop:1438 length:1227 start_codon:yes stop_codon:yes gene_type:complete
MEGDDVSFEGILATNPRSSTAASGSGGLTIHPSDTTVYYNFRVDQVDNDLRIDTNQGADKVKFGLSGSAEFAGGTVVIDGDKIETGGTGNKSISLRRDQGTIRVSSDSSSVNVFAGQLNAGTTSSIKADGSADFLGSTVNVGNLKQVSVRTSGVFLKDTGTASASNYNLKLDTNGSAAFGYDKVQVGAAGTSVYFGLKNQGQNTAYIVKANNDRFGFTNVVGNAGTSNSAIELDSNNGSATFSGQINGTTVGTSDQRFKENIEPARPQLGDVEALGAILKNFDWNADAPVNEEIRAQRQLGLIAQEAEEVCPSLTKTVTRTKQGAELTPEQVVPAEYEEVVVPAVVNEEGEVVTPATTEQVLVREEYVIPATYEQLDDNYKAISHDALIMKLLGAVAELSAKVKALEA